MSNFDQLMRWSTQARQVLGDDFWNDIMGNIGHLGNTPNLSSLHPTGNTSSNIRADLYETEKDIIAVIDIPGVESAESIDVDIEGEFLLVKGFINRHYTNEQTLVTERVSGSFERRIQLPHPIRRDGVVARYHNGVLEVRLPKTGGDRQKRQSVKVDF